MVLPLQIKIILKCAGDKVGIIIQPYRNLSRGALHSPRKSRERYRVFTAGGNRMNVADVRCFHTRQ